MQGTDPVSFVLNERLWADVWSKASLRSGNTLRKESGGSVCPGATESLRMAVR